MLNCRKISAKKLYNQNIWPMFLRLPPKCPTLIGPVSPKCPTLTPLLSLLEGFAVLHTLISGVCPTAMCPVSLVGPFAVLQALSPALSSRSPRSLPSRQSVPHVPRF